MKRFYKDVAVKPADGGWAVALDGRTIRTQAGRPQIVSRETLAELLAQEWRAQGEEIDPKSLPMRDLADIAIDQIRDDRAGAIGTLLQYAETDTLCYRADPDEPLFRRQQQDWEPLLAGMETRHNLRFDRIGGVGYRPQPAATLERLRAMLDGENEFVLAGLTTLASLAASLTVAIAALESDADAEALFTASNLEEDWQAEQWGWDAAAAERRETRLEAFRQAAVFIHAARG